MGEIGDYYVEVTGNILRHLLGNLTGKFDKIKWIFGNSVSICLIITVSDCYFHFSHSFGRQIWFT